MRAERERERAKREIERDRGGGDKVVDYVDVPLPRC